MASAISFQAGKAFRAGWKGFSRNAGVLVGFTVLAAVVLGLLQAIQYGLVAAVVVNNPDAVGGVSLLLFGIALLQAIVGLIYSIALLNGGLRSVRGESLAFSDLFSKVTEVPNLIGLQIFGTLAVLLGSLAFVIPGVYLGVAYVFAGMALVDKPQSFVDALTLSRRLVTPHWFDITIFLLVVIGIILLGYLAILIGGFVSVPVGFCMIAAGYQQLLVLADNNNQTDSVE
ncbi:hypothetical protein [Synechococcus sp. MIT S9503]|uniref:hypothetical protein n=1 Tax=Synechococcus sp. MIT S9503 TaxID=3082547 RepID=UPI0039A57B0D